MIERLECQNAIHKKVIGILEQTRDELKTGAYTKDERLNTSLAVDILQFSAVIRRGLPIIERIETRNIPFLEDVIMKNQQRLKMESELEAYKDIQELVKSGRLSPSVLDLARRFEKPEAVAVPVKPAESVKQPEPAASNVIKIDEEKKTVILPDGRTVHFTGQNSWVALSLLAWNANKAVSSQEIGDALSKINPKAKTPSVGDSVGTVRKLIEGNHKKPKLIVTTHTGKHDFSYTLKCEVKYAKPVEAEPKILNITKIDRQNRTATLPNGRVIKFDIRGRAAWEIFLFFAEHHGEWINHNKLNEVAIKAGYNGVFPGANTVKILRDKVESNPKEPVYIRSLRGKERRRDYSQYMWNTDIEWIVEEGKEDTRRQKSPEEPQENLYPFKSRKEIALLCSTIRLKNGMFIRYGSKMREFKVSEECLGVCDRMDNEKKDGGILVSAKGKSAGVLQKERSAVLAKMRDLISEVNTKETEGDLSFFDNLPPDIQHLFFEFWIWESELTARSLYEFLASTKFDTNDVLGPEVGDGIGVRLMSRKLRIWSSPRPLPEIALRLEQNQYDIPKVGIDTTLQEPPMVVTLKSGDQVEVLKTSTLSPTTFGPGLRKERFGKRNAEIEGVRRENIAVCVKKVLDAINDKTLLLGAGDTGWSGATVTRAFAKLNETVQKQLTERRILKLDQRKGKGKNDYVFSITDVAIALYYLDCDRQITQKIAQTLRTFADEELTQQEQEREKASKV